MVQEGKERPIGEEAFLFSHRLTVAHPVIQVGLRGVIGEDLVEAEILVAGAPAAIGR